MRVFILGAGFSTSAGLPTASELLGKIISQEIEPELQGLGFAGVESFEELLSKIDLEAYYSKKSGKKTERLKLLREFRNKLIQRLAAKMLVQKYQLKVYADFAKQLNPNEDAIISFNYDLILEKALEMVEVPYCYCYQSNCPADKLPVIKLHGSVNHFHCDRCDNIEIITIEDIEKGKDFFSCPKCGGGMDRAIIPPTLLKRYAGTAVEEIWPKAMYYLQNARKLYFIGYRIPDADLLSYQLFFFSFLTRKVKEQYIESILGPKENNYETFQNLYLAHGGSVRETGQYFEEWLTSF